MSHDSPSRLCAGRALCVTTSRVWSPTHCAASWASEISWYEVETRIDLPAAGMVRSPPGDGLAVRTGPGTGQLRRCEVPADVSPSYTKPLRTNTETTLAAQRSYRHRFTPTSVGQGTRHRRRQDHRPRSGG